LVKQKRNSRYLATLFLIVMALGFFITMPFQDYIIGRLLQGAFEAGVVGGLADWFAVTALFRHPLGIPIPHTALLPNNRKRMTEAATNLVENNWLSKESIKSKVAQVQITEKLLQELEKNLDSRIVRKGISSFAKKIVVQIDLDKLAGILEKEVKNKANQNSISPKAFTVARLIRSNTRTHIRAGIHCGTLGSQNFTYIPTAVISAIPVTIQQNQYVQPVIKPAHGPINVSANSVKDPVVDLYNNNSPKARITKNRKAPIIK